MFEAITLEKQDVSSELEALIAERIPESKSLSPEGFHSASFTNRTRHEFWWQPFSICGKTRRKYGDG
jgi:hypothetical protein